MIPAPPSFMESKFYDGKKCALSEDAPKKYKDEYEDFFNDEDWCEFYRELHPEMKVPFKLWNGEIVDVYDAKRKSK